MTVSFNLNRNNRTGIKNVKSGLILRAGQLIFFIHRIQYTIYKCGTFFSAVLLGNLNGFSDRYFGWNIGSKINFRDCHFQYQPIQQGNPFIIPILQMTFYRFLNPGRMISNLIQQMLNVFPGRFFERITIPQIVDNFVERLIADLQGIQTLENRNTRKVPWMPLICGHV